MRSCLVLLLAGCASAGPSIDVERTPPADWPKLEEHVFRIEQADIPERCFDGISTRANACAVTDFRNRVCNIYVATDDPAVLEHERLHCLGYDHPRASTMRAGWARYKAGGGK